MKPLKTINQLDLFMNDEIEQIIEIDQEIECYDITVLENDFLYNQPNFIANGFIVHNSGAHEDYCKRNQGLEEPECHPKLYDILGPTHGLMIYQEQIMKILHRVGKIPLKHCEAVRKAISKKKIDKFIKYKEMFIKNGQEYLGESKEYLENLFDKITYFSGYGFNLSHAVAYSYVTIREMFLKTHLPEAYFTSYLSVFKPKKSKDYDKIKDYLADVKSCGVKVSRIDINESKSHFRYDYKNQTIRYPFNKMKGVGEEVSKLIEKYQPYTNFTDFLDKFGTSSKTVQALVALGAFEGNRLILWEYYENYAKWRKAKTTRIKRYENNCKKFNEQIKKITGDDLNLELNDDSLERIYQLYPEGHKHYSRTRKMIKPFIRIVNNLKIIKPVLDLNKESVTIEKESMKNLLSLPIEEAEKIYLGFVWTNPVEEAVGVNHTFDSLSESDYTSGPVEGIILKCESKKAKTGNTYYSVQLQDALQTTKFLTIWNNDYEQFREEFMVGNIVRITLQKPASNSKFSNYLMKSTPNRFKMPEKSMDYRMKVIKWREQE